MSGERKLRRILSKNPKSTQRVCVALSLPSLAHVDIRSSWHRLSPTKSPPLPYYFFSIVSHFYLFIFFNVFDICQFPLIYIYIKKYFHIISIFFKVKIYEIKIRIGKKMRNKFNSREKMQKILLFFKSVMSSNF